MAHTIAELEQMIKYNNYLYWNNLPLKISDIEYDKLVRELEQLDPTNKLVVEFAKPNVSSSEKLIKHSKPMLSLNKIYNNVELYNWIKKVSRTKKEMFLIQPKYDGMSGLLENGTLSSRGTGEYGQDYTDKLKLIKFDSNKNIDPKKDTLLGEIIIKNSDFKTVYQNIKSKSGIVFKNQRNGIAGILGTDDVDFYANQGAKVTFVDYDKFSVEVSCEEFEAKWESIIDYILTNVDYPLDGIVIKLKDQIYSDSLGYTTHHPKGQTAFKFTNQKAESKLIDIEWGMGKQQISAIGIIKPVEISGVTIKRVKLQLTKPKSSSINTCLIDGSLQIGDFVTVERAGDIIPHIIASKPGINRMPVKIDVCPFCNGIIKINDSSIECLNKNCNEKLVQNLHASIVTLGFKNIGNSFIRTLVNDPNISVKNIYDLMSLTNEDLKLKEYGTKTKENFFNEIEKAKHTCTKEQVIASLNIPNVGKTVSKILIDNYSWDDILLGNFDHLNTIEGIGPTIQIAILSNLNSADKLNKQILINMAKLFEFHEDPVNTNSNGKTICFTGKMEYKRSDMEQMAKELGFTPIDHVDKTLNVLVCADPNSGSGKLQKAAKLGIKIMSEQDFINEYRKK